MAIFSLLFFISWKYVDVLSFNRTSIERAIHEKAAKQMHSKVESMIVNKQKSTVAIALSIANDENLIENIQKNHISDEYYKKLVKNFRDHTLYKNIWIHILNKDAVSLYRSWSNQKGDDLSGIREDLVEVIRTQKVTSSISIGKYDLSIKAIIPLKKDDRFVGMIEVISHFNSISKNMKEFNTDSVVVVAKKEYKERLKNAFTNTFIGDYYVANFDASETHMNYLLKNGIENYFNDSYKIENGYIIASHEMSDIKNSPIAYFIMFKKINNISSVDLEFYVYKWFAFGIMFLMSIMIIISTVLFYVYRRDKDYYKNIIDTSKNIIIVYDKDENVKQVNNTFFKYFTMFSSLEDYKIKNGCICNYFEDGEGYLKWDMDGTSWIDYMLEHKDENNKIKLKIIDKWYYFSVSASVVSKENGYVAVIMSNISDQEKYKHELENLTITDPLSGINNRRYFQTKIADEISRANRYKHPLSLIIFDIDFFKKVNDQHGHDVGDEVIKEYARFISEMLREEDSFCRIGGEEFSIILPHIDKGKAYKVAEKIRQSVEAHKKVLSITMSFGVVEYQGGEDAEAVFQRADKALYKAKEAGRNRVKIG